MNEYLSVKEFSRLTGIEHTTLRYWDEIGLFSPARRDPDNRYRYYAPQQVVSVNYIRVLSKLNIPLKEISGMVDTRDPIGIMELFERQEKRLDRELRALCEFYTMIHTRRDLIRSGLRADPSTIGVHEWEEHALSLGPPTEFQGDEPFYEPFMRFCRSAERLHINLSHPIGGMHQSMESYLGAPGRPDRFFSFDPAGNVSQRAGTYMVGYARGYYGEFGDLPERMEAYARENGLTCHGPVYTLYLHDELCMREPSQYLGQVIVEVNTP